MTTTKTITINASQDFNDPDTRCPQRPPAYWDKAEPDPIHAWEALRDALLWKSYEHGALGDEPVSGDGYQLAAAAALIDTGADPEATKAWEAFVARVAIKAHEWATTKGAK